MRTPKGYRKITTWHIPYVPTKDPRAKKMLKRRGKIRKTVKYIKEFM